MDPPVNSMCSGTQLTADWCQNHHLERERERWREAAVKEVQKGELLILISFGTAVVLVSVDVDAETLSFFRLG